MPKGPPVAARGDCPSRFGLESAAFTLRAFRVTRRAGGFYIVLRFLGIAMAAMTNLDLLPKPIYFASLRAEVERRLGQRRTGP